MCLTGHTACFNELLENLLRGGFCDCVVQIVCDVCRGIRTVLFAEIREDQVVRCSSAVSKDLWEEGSKNHGDGYRRRLSRMGVLSLPCVIWMTIGGVKFRPVNQTRHLGVATEDDRDGRDDTAKDNLSL